MEETGKSIEPHDLAPLLFIVPTLGLLFLAYNAHAIYLRGIEDIEYYNKNLNETMWIGAVVWAVAAGALVFLFAIEIILRRMGKGYKLPAVALVAAGTWNLLLGAITFFTDPLPCSFTIVEPNLIPSASLYLAALTFGLLLSGIAAVKFNSIEGRRVSTLLVEVELYDFDLMGRGFVRLAKWMCLLNGILALLGTLLVSFSGCLID